MPHLDVNVQPDNVTVNIGGNANTAIFVPRSATGQFASDSDILALSGFLQNLIVGSSAGVGTLNGLSGILTLSGLAGTTVYTGAGGIIYVSGSGAAGSSSISVSGTTVTNPNFLAAGNLSLILSGSNVWISGSQTGVAGDFAFRTNLITTGQTLATNLYNLSGQAAALYAAKQDTGNFVSQTQTGGLVSALDLFQTGQALWTRDLLVSGALNSSGAALSQSVNNLSGYLGTNFALKQDTGNFLSRTDTGSYNTWFALASATGNFVSQTQTGGLASILNLTQTGQIISTNIYNLSGYYNRFTVTGTKFSPLDFSGAGGISVFSTGNSLFFSGQAWALSSDTGNFVSSTQTGQFASDSDLLFASGYLITLIQGASAGVSTLNGLSGILNLAGAGNISVSTGAGTITISGNTGQLVSIFQTGFLSDVFSKVSATGSNTILSPDFTGVGNVVVTILGSSVRISGSTSAGTGTLVYSTDTGVFATVLNLAVTGQTLSANIYNLSGYLGTNFALKADTGNFVSKTDTGAYNTWFALNSATGNFVSQTQTGGLSSALNVALTGQTISTNIYNLSGYYNRFTVTGLYVSPVDFSGAGGVRVFTTGTSLFFSGVNLASANDTGNFVSKTETGAYDTRFAFKYDTGNFVSQTQTGGLANSWNLIQTGSYLDNKLNFVSGLVRTSGVGAQGFELGLVAIPTGTGPFGFTFSQPFGIKPKVVGDLINDNSDDPTLSYQLSGINVTGFYLVLSQTITSTNYRYNYMATTGDGRINLGAFGQAPLSELAVNSTISSGVVSLNTTPLQVFTGNLPVIWTLPAISTSTGRMYFVKNRGGATLTISGTTLNQIYDLTVVSFKDVLSGEAYIFANDSLLWEVM